MASWHPVGKQYQAKIKLPPSPREEEMWVNRLVDGGSEWGAIRRVIIRFRCGDRKSTRRHLASPEIDRFHEDEAITHKLGVTERGVDGRNVLYCRLTAYGQAISDVWYAPWVQVRVRAMAKELPEQQVIDAINAE